MIQHQKSKISGLLGVNNRETKAAIEANKSLKTNRKVPAAYLSENWQVE